MNRMHTILFAALTLSLLAGCGGLSRKPVEKRFYTLDVKREVVPIKADSPSVGLLKIRRMQVSPLYDGRELVYKYDGGRVESDFYNLFFMPPVELLSHDLQRWLQASGVFGSTITTASLAEADYTLEGVVNALYGDFAGGQRSAVVEMQFFLIDERKAADNVAFSRSYLRRVSLPDSRPASLIDGMRQGVRAVFTELENDLRMVARDGT